MYTNLKTVLRQATELEMAIGAFNVHNLEMLPAVIAAAKAQGTPVIIQTSVGTAKYVGHKNLVAVCKSMADESGIDLVLHLDHAQRFEDIKEAIDAGYGSVMFDGSKFPLKENILKTRQIIAYAKQFDVSVEAELGIVGGTEDGAATSLGEERLTDPNDAVIFIAQTGIDALAVAIGTNHGQYKSKTNINFACLAAIRDAVDIPLVIHGGTGVKEEDIKKVIDLGIRKFNVGTELLVAWTKKSKELYAQTADNASLRDNIIPCMEAVNTAVQKKIALFKNIK